MISNIKIILLFLVVLFIILICLLCVNEKSYFSDFRFMQKFTSARIDNNNKRIPLIIHQTHKDLKIPVNMYNNMHKWIDSNKEFEHRYYDDKMIEEIISKYPDPQVHTAFKKLKKDLPTKGAMRADLFRLVIIEQNGGVYLDADTSTKDSAPTLIDLIKDNDEFVSGIGGRNDLHQWCIISIPKHPFISAALKETVKIILSEGNDNIITQYGKLEGLTGPPRYDYAIRKYLKNKGISNVWQPGEYFFTDKNKRYQFRIVNGDYMGNTIIFKYDGYNEDLKKMGIKHWGQ